MVLTLVLLPAVAGMMDRAMWALPLLQSIWGSPSAKDRIYRHYDAGRSPSGAVDYGRSAATGSRELFTLSVLALA